MYLSYSITRRHQTKCNSSPQCWCQFKAIICFLSAINHHRFNTQQNSNKTVNSITTKVPRRTCTIHTLPNIAYVKNSFLQPVTNSWNFCVLLPLCTSRQRGQSSSLSLPRQQNYLQQQLRLLLLPVSALKRLRQTSETSTYSFIYQILTATNNLTPALTYFFKVSKRINVSNLNSIGIYRNTNCTVTVYSISMAPSKLQSSP